GRTGLNATPGNRVSVSLLPLRPGHAGQGAGSLTRPALRIMGAREPAGPSRTPAQGAPGRGDYDGGMSRRPRSLVQRVREHIGFSVIAIGVLCMLLRLVGVRSTFAGFVLSVALTLALNVGLSYYNDHRARNPRPQRPARGGGDIRFREDDRRGDPRDVGIR